MRRTLLNGQFQVFVLCVLALLSAIPLAAASAEEKPAPKSQKDEKEQLISDLQQQLLQLHQELKRQIVQSDGPTLESLALQNKITALNDKLIRLVEERRVQSAADRKHGEGLTPPASTTEKAIASLGAHSREAEATQATLLQTRAQLAERERQLAEYSQQLAKFERASALPPLQNAQVKVFSLVNQSAAEAAKTLESLFGLQTLRIATDERANALIVMGTAETLPAVEALLMRLDQKADASGNPEGTAAASPAAPRSLLLRIFWLADGLPEGEGQEPTDYLPRSVIKATERLGLNKPRLVTQTVNSLAVGAESAVEFSTSVPAIVFELPAGLNCSGQMRPLAQDRASLQVQIQVSGTSINCQLSGSLATPLGHYMVLGTANSVIDRSAAIAQASPMGMGMAPGMMGGYGGEMGMYGRGGEGGYLGRPGGEYGRLGAAGRPAAVLESGPVPAEGAAVDPATGAPVEGESPPAGVEGEAAQPAVPKYNTSRFAFVVQVIEGESFPAEKLDALPAGALR
jgi:hypothetical protein